VLGASEPQVVGMFVWSFVKIFLAACVIALPVAYLLAENWLKSFVYREPLSILIFATSLLGLLFITLVTVSYETWKAARANPVTSLRSE
jgi:putative ABC transport system permease protein